MGLVNFLELNMHYLLQEEYEKLDVAMDVHYNKNPYPFVSAIYNQGVILCIIESPTPQELNLTKLDFPILSKLIKLAIDKNISYIDLVEESCFLSVSDEKFYELNLYTW